MLIHNTLLDDKRMSSQNGSKTELLMVLRCGHLSVVLNRPSTSLTA